MDPYSSSGEILNIKTRKPYTITKQRERWTEEEHNSFLEALKLYGRAWQRIEEHIGTKTAVQIRSHAQKFFTKLEKEAVAKGVPTRQALDMEIPPPRPKRKPTYPYPRKNHHPKDNAAGQPALESGIQILDLERKPLPETTTLKHENAKTHEQVENEEVPCASLSSENETCVRSFRDFINLDEKDKSYVTTNDTRKHQKSDQDTSNISLFDFPEGENPDNTCGGGGGGHNYPRHVPVQVVDGNQGTITGEESTVEEVHNPNRSSVNNNIASSSSYQTIPPTFHFTPFCDNQENSYTSFLHVSSTISSLIVSSLLQNPAAHAAASFAAKFWHPTGNNCGDSSFSSRELENATPPPPPSMAAIAAATVAAATAWWAAHGLIPVCTPFSLGCGTPVAAAANNNEREKAPEILNMEHDDTITTTKPVVGKQVDRSSCGSNTTSSSEIETDALEKNIKEKEEIKGGGGSDIAANNDSVSRSRVRSNTINPNESWKEVSEEGRLAFQALFSRQVLPQSFSDGHNNNEDGLDLNRMSQQLLRGEKERLLTIGLNVHHTGFKPYKRCSMEAKDKSKIVGGTSDDKGAKRMRFEADKASN